MRMSGRGRKRKERRDDALPKPFANISLSIAADAHWDVNKEYEERKSDLEIYSEIRAQSATYWVFFISL